MFAPSCTELQLDKLELKHIKFIPIPKVIKDIDNNNSKNISEKMNNPEIINVNLAEIDDLKTIFKGTKISSINTFNKLIKGRPYNNIEDLIKKMKFSDTCKRHLQSKLAKGEISFNKLN